MNATTKRTVSTLLAIAIAGSLFTTSFVSGFLLHRVAHGSTASLLAALLPLPFFALSFGAIFWFARRCDEMQRRIQFEALAFAYPLAMIAAMGIFMVRKAGFEFPFDLADLFIAMVLLYTAGVLVARRRYR